LPIYYILGLICYVQYLSFVINEIKNYQNQYMYNSSGITLITYTILFLENATSLEVGETIFDKMLSKRFID